MSDAVTYSCPECGAGAEWISFDTISTWDPVKQEMVHQDSYAHKPLCACGYEGWPNEVPYKPQGFNHMCVIAFEVIASTEDGSDITSGMLADAMRKRIETLDSAGDLAWQQAVDITDVYEIQENPEPSQ